VPTLATSPTRLPCLHCGRLCPVHKLRRGLCRSHDGGCHTIPKVRDRYGYTGTLRHLDGPIWTQDVRGPVPQPPPTSADPGTPEKRAAIFRRARKRQALFHREDPALPLRELAMAPRLAWLWRLLIGVDPTIADVLKELAQIAAGPTYQRQRRKN
jgi:hypothetical protein